MPGPARSAPGTEDTDQPNGSVLPPDGVVDLTQLRREAGIDDVMAELNRDLIGLEPVKKRIQEIAALLLIDRTRERFGICSPRPNLHMSFTGKPGTGKTTVAVRTAELLKRLRYLRRGHLVAVTRDDLVGQYVGHTAPKTREVVKRAMGGVLFIDEAYYLHRADNERDYGQESIEILLQVMENNRDDLAVILAGYADRMDEFFASNPGMSSRIAHHIDFPDYTLDELERIGHLMARDLQYAFSPEAEQVFREYLQRRSQLPRFANARSVRNAVERARLRQANRLVGMPDGAIRRRELMLIEAGDLLASRVFANRANGDRGAQGDPS